MSLFEQCDPTNQSKVLFARIEHLQVVGKLDRHFASRNTSFTVERDHLFDSLIYRLSRRVIAGDTTEDSTTVTWPEDWWQAFKIRFFPKWYLKRWPARSTSRTIATRITRMCPHVDIPRGEEHFRWVTANELNPVRGYDQ